VDANALGGVLLGGRLRQAHHAVLGRRVGRGVGEAYQPEDGCGVDDGPAAALQHHGDLVLHAPPHAGQVDVDDPLPCVLRVLVGGGQRAFDTRVVEGHVQPTEAIDGQLHHGLDVLIFGDVGLDPCRFATGVVDHLGRLLGAGLGDV